MKAFKNRGKDKDPQRWQGDLISKNLKASYKTVVQTHTQNFSTLAQLESVKKSGERFDFSGVSGAPILKNRKTLLQNGGPNTHPKFQHSSSIGKCSKIGELIRLLGFNPP